MGILFELFLSGLAVGSMYAIGTISLAMIWGSLGMLNLAHGAVLAIGGYGAYATVGYLGLPWWLGVLGGLVAGALAGVLLYLVIVRWLQEGANFAVNIIIATFAAGVLLQNLLLEVFDAEPKRQPFSFSGGFRLGDVVVPGQTVAVLLCGVLLATFMSWYLGRTGAGRAIRAVSQDRTAAALIGLDVDRVFVKLLALSGALSALSGVLLTGMTTVTPTVGFDPMLKALMICVVAGLGSLWGAVGFAVFLGLFEVALQYLLGARFGFPGVFALAVLILVLRPYGLFGKKNVVRV